MNWLEPSARKEAPIHFQTSQGQKQLEKAAMLIRHLLGNHNINKWGAITLDTIGGSIFIA